MLKIYALLYSSLLLGCVSSQKSLPEASFAYLKYVGNDSFYRERIDVHHTYFNPVIKGYYPDPSVCRKGDTYYLVNSSFAYYPGIPIFKSTDLVNWQQIGHVLNRPSQLNLDGLPISAGIYAPVIEYNPHNDTFYLITTCVGGIHNFLVTSRNPEQGWSDPIVLPKVGGIDPSLFFDDDGTAFIVHNDAPQGIPLYDGHRAIWIHRFDTESNTTIGTPKMIVDGGVNISTKPIWIEGPHLYKKNGSYFLMAAEGGTGSNHSEVIFRSDKPDGIFVPCHPNPILTQRHLPADRNDAVTCVGHADIIRDTQGQYWALFLGCLPYRSNLYNTGRETFLLPVSWHDGSPVILDSNLPVPLKVDKDILMPQEKKMTGNFKRDYRFQSNGLDPELLMIRTPRNDFYRIGNGKLWLKPLSSSVNEISNPAFIGCRQYHANFSLETELTFTINSENQFAGVVCFQNEKYRIDFGKCMIDGISSLILVRVADGQSKQIALLPLSAQQNRLPIKLRIDGRGDFYTFSAFIDSITTPFFSAPVDATHLSTEQAGGFTGTVIGMYASSNHLIAPLD